jgi:hypothetical protein
VAFRRGFDDDHPLTPARRRPVTTCEFLARFRHLSFEGVPITAEDLNDLAAGPHLARLFRLIVEVAMHARMT